MIFHADPEVAGVSKNPRRRRVDVNINQLDGIIDSAQERALNHEECHTLREAIHALAAQLGPWCNSEKVSKVLKALSGEASEMAPARPRPAGHGRNGAAALTGAERVRVPNQLA